MRCWQWSILACVLAVLAAGGSAQAQLAPAQPQPSDATFGDRFVRFFHDGEWYFSYGTNKEYWAPTDIHVSQPGQGNDFTIYGVHGHDDGIGLGDIATGDLFGPQYNLRVGRFITENFAIEFSLDHSKYQNDFGTYNHIGGQIGGKPVSDTYPSNSLLLTNQTFYEELHNGANHIMINGVYRLPLFGKTNETFSLAAIGKAGVGIMLPHTSDTIFGNPVDVGEKSLSNSVGLRNGWWQLNGWTTGVEGGLRFVVWKPVYIEVTDKLAYAYLADLPAYQGTISESLLMNEVIFSLGFTYDGTSKSAN